MFYSDMTEIKRTEKRLKKFIRLDQTGGFISLLKDQLKKKNLGQCGSGSIFSPTELLKLICSSDAVRCATALLEGGTVPRVDPNVALEDGLTPLHLAAQSLSPSLTELFLRYGAHTNPSHDNDLAKLPLSYALRAICDDERVRDWGPEKSIFKLFYILCLRELKRPLETVKLLALRTEELDMLSMSYVMKGDLVRLAVLLLVAGCKLVDPFANKGIEGSPTGQCILDELRVVSEYKGKLVSPSDDRKLIVLDARKANLESAWKMLEILEKGRGAFLDYFQQGLAEVFLSHEVPFQVGGKLLSYGVPLELHDVYSDDVKCLLPGLLKPRQKASFDRALAKQMRLRSASSASRPLNSNSEGRKPGKPSGQRFGAGNLLNSRSFHTCPGSNSNSMGSQLAPALSEFLPPAKVCSLLVSAVRRSIK